MYMAKSPTWAVGSSSATVEILRIFLNQNANYRGQNRSPFISLLRQINPVPPATAIPGDLFNTYFNSALPSVLGCS
jgi:hypothetical protein